MRLYCSFSGTQKSTGRRDFLAPKPVLRLEHLSLLPWSFACTSPNISCFTVFIRPRVSHVWFFAIPWTVARQVPLSMGFSRQEYWSGLPRPPPGDIPNPGIEPRSPALQVDSLPSEPPGKLKNTRVGSLSLLQRTFPTQELNPGLLHCRQILYQPSHQGSPCVCIKF